MDIIAELLPNLNTVIISTAAHSTKGFVEDFSLTLFSADQTLLIQPHLVRHRDRVP